MQAYCHRVFGRTWKLCKFKGRATTRSRLTVQDAQDDCLPQVVSIYITRVSKDISLIILCIYINLLHMTSKQPSWGTTSKFHCPTERIIDENSMVKWKKVKHFMLYIYKYRIFIDNLLCWTTKLWSCPSRWPFWHHTYCIYFCSWCVCI